MSPPIPALCGSTSPSMAAAATAASAAVPPSAQHLQPRLRGKRLARRHHAAGGEHLRPRLLRPRPQPIATHRLDALRPGSVISAVGVPNGVGDTPKSARGDGDGSPDERGDAYTRCPVRSPTPGAPGHGPPIDSRSRRGSSPGQNAIKRRPT